MIMDHVDHVCTETHDDGRSCMFCDGGLFACTVCDAFEGATPDECPGVRMTTAQSNAVYAGTLNYRDGTWREGECCQVMRPTHDRDAYMAEHGYVRVATEHGHAWATSSSPEVLGYNTDHR